MAILRIFIDKKDVRETYIQYIHKKNVQRENTDIKQIYIQKKYMYKKIYIKKYIYIKKINK